MTRNVAFLRAINVGGHVVKMDHLRTAVDEFHLHQREIYWLCRIRSSESEFSLARLEKALGVQATFRNSTAISKARRLNSALPSRYNWIDYGTG